MHLVKITGDLFDRTLTFPMHEIDSGVRAGNVVDGDIEVAGEKRGECERALHHHAGGQKTGVTGIHVAKMDFSLIGDRGAAEQTLVAVEKVDGYSLPRQRDRNAAALKAASQNRYMHADVYASLACPLRPQYIG
jgi:hypothetical protein